MIGRWDPGRLRITDSQRESRQIAIDHHRAVTPDVSGIGTRSMWRALSARYIIKSVTGHTVVTVGRIEIKIYRTSRGDEDEINNQHR